VDKPVRTTDDSKLPLGATVAIGGLALFGAITLVSWLFSAVLGVAKFVIAIVVVLGLISWLANRRLDRR
jgi:uncharacterized membrane protein